MSLNALFVAASWSVVPAWLLLLFVPRARATRWLAQVIVPAALATAYVILLLSASHIGGYESLRQLATTLHDDHVMLAAWIHYLVFDLLVGNWIALDAGRLGIPRPAIAPCLILTLFFGPAGWFCYLLLRTAKTPRLAVDS